MNTKTITIDVKADSGSITGYASTWTREPDSYGDVVAKGAFAEHIAQIKEEGRVLPFLFNHNSSDLKSYIGTVVDLEEDDHGLKFTAVFDDTEEGQKARLLASNGRLCKFSFAYDVLDAAEVELEDGRKANELRKLNIHEVSLVLYPANPDTSTVSVKAGRRNRKSDEEIIKQIISLANQLLTDEVDDTEEEPKESEAKSEERDTANDEEQKRKAELLENANKLLEEVNT
jgi:HK97 family phage prohead protease